MKYMLFLRFDLNKFLWIPTWVTITSDNLLSSRKSLRDSLDLKIWSIDPGVFETMALVF